MANPYEQTAGQPDYRQSLVQQLLQGAGNTGYAGGTPQTPAVEPPTVEQPAAPVPAAPTYANVAGFDASKFGKDSKPGSKYTKDAGVYSQAIGSGVNFDRNNLGGLVDFYKQHGYGDATAVGDDKIDPDGAGPMAPIDVIQSNGTKVYQNTTGNPQWEAQYGGGSAQAPASGGFTAAPGISPMLQSNAFGNVQQALSGLQDNSLLQRLIAQLSGAQ